MVFLGCVYNLASSASDIDTLGCPTSSQQPIITVISYSANIKFSNLIFIEYPF